MIGKIIGGVAGASFGLHGALLGICAGHVYDRLREQRNYSADFLREAEAAGIHIGGSMDQVAFTVGMVVLGAKMAKIDGTVTRDEIDAFKRVFRVPPQQEAQIGALFDQARRDAEGYEHYAAHLAHLFRNRPAVLEELLTGLMLIAAADGDIIAAEDMFLRDIGGIFGFSFSEFNLIAARSGVYRRHRGGSANGNSQSRAAGAADGEDPYDILGVTRGSTPEEMKSAYRKLILEHHPDRLVAAGMAPEFVSIATEKMKRINAAYDSLCKERNIA